jgi:CheY-like chemotaxis protein
MSILIVDDNEVLLILLEKMLQAQNYSTVWAASGAEAWNVLETNMDIRLVISDIVMPEMSGLELLSRMKKSVVFRDIPFILCTVLADTESVRQGALLGCHSYLVKPVQRDHLLQKVNQALLGAKPVMSSLRLIQAKYGLEKQNCVDVMKAFLKLLKAQIDGLEAHIKESQHPLPPVLLRQLSEGAGILGAEQLEMRIVEMNRAMESKVDLELHTQRLLRDMRHLAGVLEKQISDAMSNAPSSDTVYIDRLSMQRPM